MVSRPLAPIALSIVAGLMMLGSARAQERTDYNEIYDNILGSIGFGKERDPIDYSPRAPIVVPPTNNLPPPAEPGQQRAAGFPDDPDVAARRKALIDPRQPAPGSAGGARAYLIEPPAAYFDASAFAATGRNADRGDAEPAKKHTRHHHTGVAPQ